MSNDAWMYGPLAEFRCLSCAAPIGRYPAATRGIRPLCAACAAKPKTLNVEWLRAGKGRA